VIVNLPAGSGAVSGANLTASVMFLDVSIRPETAKIDFVVEKEVFYNQQSFTPVFV